MKRQTTDRRFEEGPANVGSVFRGELSRGEWLAACRQAVEAGKRVPADTVDTALAHAALRDRPAHDLKPLAREAADHA